MSVWSPTSWCWCWCRSGTTGGRRLHLTSPALTKRIQRLEGQLGVALVARRDLRRLTVRDRRRTLDRSGRRRSRQCPGHLRPLHAEDRCLRRPRRGPETHRHDRHRPRGPSQLPRDPAGAPGRSFSRAHPLPA
ncbi:LysR family transcriptional regulator [Streptosporangium sp. 'caverna']|uniref:helix-turn-helix domain-containing protein n=1 Tax=Streptosporangium sp. 'caverna' TaxID=2202249 RepID=UPI003511D73E